MALRRFINLLQIHASAHGRRAMAATAARGAHARARAVARFRAIRAEGEARARSAHAYILGRLLQAGAASAAARHHLRQATDTAVTAFLRALYGQPAPRTPSPLEILQLLAHLAERVNDIGELVSRVDKFLNEIIPIEVGMLLAVLLAPIAAYYKDVISSAPEVACPFLGIRALEVDVPVEEGLRAVFTLSLKCGGMVTLVIGALIILAFVDLATFAVRRTCDDASREDIFDDTIALTYIDGESTQVHYQSWGPAR